MPSFERVRMYEKAKEVFADPKTGNIIIR